METMTWFFETEPLIDLGFAKQSRLAGQWAPQILFFNVYFSNSDYKSISRAIMPCFSSHGFWGWNSGPPGLPMYLYISYMWKPHPSKVPVDQERAKNSVAFSAWFSQVSSSYHSDTSQAHRKKPCGSEHLGKSRPWRLVQVGLHQEPSLRDRLV